MSEVVKLTVNVSKENYDLLKSLAKSRSSTVTEVLKHAIGTEKFFDQATREEQGKILVEDKKGNVREVVFQR